MGLQTALLDPDRFVCLYGTTPPRADVTEERMHRAATRLAERLRGLNPDGLIVYDVQDESSRTAEPRPFPYLPTLDSRIYARLLEQTTGLPTITYKCVAHTAPQDWEQWLNETAETYGLHCLTLVGRASSRTEAAGAASNPDAGISLGAAQRQVTHHPHGFLLGGVVIPERHSPTRSESARLIRKAEAGCRFFTSQAIYDPHAAIALCRDYARDCAEHGVPPRRILLTFTPCGRPETLRFIQWLGVRVPEAVEQAILSASDPLAASMDACVRSLQTILESGIGSIVPLGINVESVSIRKEEIDASVELCARLREIASPI